MTVRMKAEENVARMSVAPYLSVFVARTVLLDDAMTEIRGRTVENIRLQFGGSAGTSHDVDPTHLPVLIRELEKARDAMNPLDPDDED